MTPSSIKGYSSPAAVLTLVLVLAIALAAGLGACGGDGVEPSNHASPQPSETPKAGGTLTVAYLTEPVTLDPALAQSPTERAVAQAVYQGLLRYAPKPGAEGTVLEPCLAAELPTTANQGISADGTTYTFTLRQGVRFQPPLSRELTANDVKYSFERMMDTAPSKTSVLYEDVVGTARFLAGDDDEISGIEVVDDMTIRFRLAKPAPSFLKALALEPCGVVPREWVEEQGAEFGLRPLGTGPFVFLKWVLGERITLARNPSYWEAGRPFVDALDYQLALEPSVAVAKLQTGEVDALGFGLPPEGLPAFASEPAWQETIQSRSMMAGTYLFLNTGMEPFDDVAVRRAVSWAIDRERLAAMQAGRAQALWQYYPPDLPGFEEGRAFYGDTPARAKAMLRKAGYPQGFKTVLSTDSNALAQALARSVQADLAAIGVQAKLKIVSRARYQRQQATPMTLAMGGIAWQASLPDPGEWVQSMCSRESARRGGSNPSFWWSAELESACAEADATTDPAARLRKYAEIESTIASAAPYVPLYSSVQTTMCSRQVGGFYLHPVYLLDPANYWKQ
jgi:ABC-type transport system substrate-binding protein